MTASSTHDDLDSNSDPDAKPENSTDEEAQASAEGEDAVELDPLQALQAQVAEFNDRWLRARAELENVRRRARLDVAEARQFGTCELLREVLPVLDALQRALQSSSPEQGGTLFEGIAMTEQQLLTVLERQGVTPVAAEPGTPLDPECHRALVEQPTDQHPPSTIVAEITRGFRLNERLLREAEVVVARRPDSTGS